MHLQRFILPIPQNLHVIDVNTCIAGMAVWRPMKILISSAYNVKWPMCVNVVLWAMIIMKLVCCWCASRNRPVANLGSEFEMATIWVNSAMQFWSRGCLGCVFFPWPSHSKQKNVACGIKQRKWRWCWSGRVRCWWTLRHHNIDKP